MYYQTSPSDSAYDQKKEMIIDFRSDTLTKPTKEMREAMFNADVGDDVFNEDPTVKKLQEAAAKMIGMEDSLFVSSGTMGNLIASAPVGSLLCGSRAFIANARRMRKVLGGGMRQVGVLAAAGLVALRHIPNLANDHKKALMFACAINEVRSSRYSVDLSTVQTNMVFVDVDSKVADAEIFVRCLQDEDKEKIVVKCLALSDSQVRFVFSREITDDGLALAIKKVTRVIRKLDVNL